MLPCKNLGLMVFSMTLSTKSMYPGLSPLLIHLSSLNTIIVLIYPAQSLHFLMANLFLGV